MKAWGALLLLLGQWLERLLRAIEAKQREDRDAAIRDNPGPAGVALFGNGLRDVQDAADAASAKAGVDEAPDRQ